jgi:hypothetical protein
MFRYSVIINHSNVLFSITIHFLLPLLAYFPILKRQSRLMRSRCCLCVCVSVYPLLLLLGNGSVKVPLSLLGNGSVKIPLSLPGNGLVKIPLSLLINGW